MLDISGIRIVHATTTILIFSIFIIFLTGLDAESFDSILILTGRLGLILFALSFGASKFHAIFRAGWSRQLLKNRRHIGIAAALVMFVHLIWIYAKVLAIPEWWATVSQYEKIMGTVTLLLICLMGLTSNPQAVKRMGFTRWKFLHLIGGYLALWFFAREYVLLFFPDPENQESHQITATSYLLLLLVLTVVVVRLWKSRLIKIFFSK